MSVFAEKIKKFREEKLEYVIKLHGDNLHKQLSYSDKLYELAINKDSLLRNDSIDWYFLAFRYGISRKNERNYELLVVFDEAHNWVIIKRDVRLIIYL